jgi:hypothetical protein
MGILPLGIRGSKDCSAIYCVCSFRKNHFSEASVKSKRVMGFGILGHESERQHIGYTGFKISPGHPWEYKNAQHSALNCICSIGKDIMVTGFGISGHGSRDNGAMGRDIAWASGGANNAQHSTVHAVLG